MNSCLLLYPIRVQYCVMKTDMIQHASMMHSSHTLGQSVVNSRN